MKISPFGATTISLLRHPNGGWAVENDGQKIGAYTTTQEMLTDLAAALCPSASVYQPVQQPEPAATPAVNTKPEDKWIYK